MKTILVPTDFSPNSAHAARYALNLASQIGAGIILFNVYSFPVLISEVPVQPYTDEEIKQASVRDLRKLAAKLKKQNTGVSIKIASTFGAPDEQIINKAERSRADMIIMGTRGQSSFLGGLFGNTTTAVCRQSRIPVLAIPAHASYRTITNVLVACDRGQTFSDPIILALKKLSSAFQARLEMIRVVNIGEFLIRGGSLENERALDKKLGATPHAFGFEVMAEAVDGIIHAADKTRSDMVVLISHKHDIVGRILHGTTRQMVRLAKKPILVLPESITEKRVNRIFEEETAKN
jgi:nucleotide-binding universal stress UspA family protein